MAAVHFSALPVTNAKPWSHPLLTLLQPRRRTLHAVLDVAVQSLRCVWLFATTWTADLVLLP
jgi:hypothetical protein